MSFEEQKKEIVLAALRRGGSQAKAAKLLGVTQRTIRNWAKKMNLHRGIAYGT